MSGIETSSYEGNHKEKKPWLLPRHQKKRKNFALRYKDWAVEGWKGVIWSGETKINRLGSDGRE